MTQNANTTGEKKRSALNEELSDLYRSTPLAMIQIDLDHKVRRSNLPAETQAELSVREVASLCAEDIEHRPDSSCRKFFDQVRETGEPCQQVRSFRPGGEFTQLSTYNTLWYPIFDDDGEVCAVGAITEDITEVDQRERTLKHIARELQHRVKNTLANVIALVEQAERSAANRDDALAILKRRVLALSTTHSRLTESNWGPTSLRDILEQEMVGVYGADVISLDGPDLLMTAQSALAFSMGLHEMTANAANYGSLSEPGGRISLHWTIAPTGEDGGWIHFEWKEEGGPSLADAPPNGFGHRLIEASLRTSLRGKMDRVWEEDGLRYSFSLPLALVTGS